MQCFKCQAHGHIAANCDNMQRCPKCGEHHHVKDCNQYGSCCANCNGRHSVAYKGCQKYKEAKLKARAESYAEALKHKPEYKNKERAQKMASDAQTQIENNLESMLWNHFSKLENKIEQITKIANERLRIDLQSQIDQLNINLQNTIKINEKTRENIRKTIMEDVTNVLCEILKDNKLTEDEVKMRHKLNRLSENRTKNQNTQQ